MPLDKRTMRFLLLAVPLLLAGCGSDEPVDNGANIAAPVLRKGPMLGSVDLSRPVLASGTSPFWVLEVEPGRITLSNSNKPGSKVTDFYPVSPKVDADHAVFSTQTPEGDPVTITLTRGPCVGGKVSEAADPLTAELKIGMRVLAGCARSKPMDEIEAEPSNGSAAPASGNAGG